MNIIALLLKNLPASTSTSGTLDKLDLQKTSRMWVVVLVGVFGVTFFGSLASVCNVDSCDLTTGVQQILLTALNAGLAATGAAAMELLRRLFAKNA